MKRNTTQWLVACALAAAVSIPAVAADARTATPPQLVETYDSLANAILATKKTEWNLVHSILAMTYSHAEATMNDALAKIAAGQDARSSIEALATLVSQLGNEGDASVAAIRKRLVDAGHHHHADDGQDGQYDPGFVIVTKDIKKTLLDASKAIAQQAGSPSEAGLKAQWQVVQQQFRSLHEGAR